MLSLSLQMEVAMLESNMLVETALGPIDFPTVSMWAGVSPLYVRCDSSAAFSGGAEYAIREA
jgi:hypothetical protein